MKKLTCDMCGGSDDTVSTYNLSKTITSRANYLFTSMLTSSGVNLPQEVELCRDCDHKLEEAYRDFVNVKLGIRI